MMFFPGYTWSNTQSRTPKEKSPWAKPSYLYHSTIPYIAVSQCFRPPHPTSASRASLQPWCLALPSSRSLCSPDFSLYSLFSPCPHSLLILSSPVTFATVTTPRSFAQAFCSCFPLPVLPGFLLHCLLVRRPFLPLFLPALNTQMLLVGGHWQHKESHSQGCPYTGTDRQSRVAP